jgi:hypothetical protein
MMVYKAMSHVTLLRIRELSPSPTLVFLNKRRLLSEYPSYNGVKCPNLVCRGAVTVEQRTAMRQAGWARANARHGSSPILLFIGT